MGDARDVVSNDIVVGGDLDDLEANQVAKEEGAVDKTQGTAGQGAFATFAGPCLTGSVVWLDSDHQVGVWGGREHQAPWHGYIID